MATLTEALAERESQAAPPAPRATPSPGMPPQEESPWLGPMWRNVLLGGGAAALALAAARRPELKALMDRFWWEKLKMPPELGLTRRLSSTPLISEFERFGTNVTEKFGQPGATTGPLAGKAWRKPEGFLGEHWKALKAVPQEDVTRTEREAWTEFLRLKPSIGEEAARERSVQLLPKAYQEYDAWRQSRLPVEQVAKKILGLEEFGEVPGPYIPRRLSPKSRTPTLRDQGSLYGGIKTSLGGFQAERRFNTREEAEYAMSALKKTYEPTLASILSREMDGIRLVETANMVARLKDRVLFETEEAATAAAKRLGITTRPAAVEGIPGAKTWWTVTEEEREFLLRNLAAPKEGRLADLKRFADAIGRNPNLINPLPHFLKNMLYKYGLAQPGGLPAHVWKDMTEYWQGVSPDVLKFKTLMPHATTGSTSGIAFTRAFSEIPDGSVTRFLSRGLNWFGATNRLSSWAIFAKLDPAIRYADVKRYIAKGMAMEDAVNHAHVDLVRYGTRSELVDFWKSWPFNFFVPWRVGSMTSVWKQLTDHPLRTAAFIGGIDLLREMRYRKTGRWTHLPWDYIQVPIATILMTESKGETERALIAAGLGTLLGGPGGAFSFSTIADAANFASGRQVDWDRFGNLFWGYAMFYNLPKEGRAFADAWAKRDTARAASVAASMVATIALAEHRALNYRPRRLLALLPDVQPGLEASAAARLYGALLGKSDDVRQAEAMQRGFAARRDLREQRKSLRPRITIEDRMEKSQGARP